MNHRASKFTRVVATYTGTAGERAAYNQSEDKDPQHEEQEMVHVILSGHWQITESRAIELGAVTWKGRSVHGLKGISLNPRTAAEAPPMRWHARREHCFET